MNNWYNLSAPNMGLLFYKQLYKDIDAKLLKINEKGALAFDVNDKKSEFLSFYDAMYKKRIDTYYLPKPIAIGSHQFTLYTTYPGLLIGSGYAHSTNTTGDASIGFYFDHTTGLPTIPGSSVKGVMRSVFELDEAQDGNFYSGKKSLDAILFLVNKILEKDKGASIEQRNQLEELKSKLEAQKEVGDFSFMVLKKLLRYLSAFS
jgi:CRISPR-associated protein Cmr6